MTDDRIDIGTAMKLLNGERPMATCPSDDEPLISTLRFFKAEFFCMVCGRKYGFLAPKPAPWTQELQDRHDALKRAFVALCTKVDTAAAEFEHEWEKVKRLTGASVEEDCAALIENIERLSGATPHEESP